MANDSTEIVIGANGSVKVAPVDTEPPADISAAWTGWFDLGFCSDDGVKITDSKTVGQVDVWQSFYPARRFITARDLMVAFSLAQWNKINVRLGFGGGTVTEDDLTYGYFRYVPPDPEFIDERSLGVEWLDGDKKYRLIIPRGLVTENVETTVARKAPSLLPITFGIIGEDNSPPWFLLTDDPSFA